LIPYLSKTGIARKVISFGIYSFSFIMNESNLACKPYYKFSDGISKINFIACPLAIATFLPKLI